MLHADVLETQTYNFLPSIAQQSLYVIPGLTYKNSASCLHRVSVCFLLISEKTVIIPLYINNCMVFIIETACLLRGTICVLAL
jgi:hypothetical protein